MAKGSKKIKQLPTRPTSVNAVKRSPYVRQQHVSTSKDRLRPKKERTSLQEEIGNLEKSYKDRDQYGSITDKGKKYISDFVKGMKDRPQDQLHTIAESGLGIVEVDSFLSDHLDSDGMAKLALNTKDPFARSMLTDRMDNKSLHKLLDKEKNPEVIQRMALNIDQKGLHRIVDRPETSGDDYSILITALNRMDTAGAKKIMDKANWQKWLKNDTGEEHVGDHGSRFAKKLFNKLGMDDLRKFIDGGGTAKNAFGDDIAKDSFLQRASYSELKKKFPNERVTKFKEKHKGLLEGVDKLKTHEELVNHFSKNLPDNIPEDENMPGLKSLFRENTTHFSQQMDYWLFTMGQEPTHNLKFATIDSFGGQFNSTKNPKHREMSEPFLRDRYDGVGPEIKADLARGLQISKALSRSILDKRFPGQDTIELFRGTSRPEVNIKRNKEGVPQASASSDPLSSWTPNPTTASSFANQRGVLSSKKGLVLRTHANKDNVIGTNQFWSKEGAQQEHIVNFSRPVSVDVMRDYNNDYQHDDWDQFWEHDPYAEEEEPY